MASEASWQTSGAGQESGAFSADQPMDQRTVETLLRRLVERVEESERRYGEALDELHARLDQLSQTTQAAREASVPEDTETFERLQAEVSNLARRFEQDTSLEDFERLGRALSGGLRHDLEAQTEPFEPSPFAQAAMSAKAPSRLAPASDLSPFNYPSAAPSYGAPSGIGDPLGLDAADLDKRLVEMAERLERSIGEAMPTSTIQTVNARLDEIGNQLTQALETVPAREALAQVERQISDMSQQLNRAEEQLGKVSGIEAQLVQLMERVDEKAQAATQADPAQLEEIAGKAATEAARLVAGEAKQTNDRLDALQRDFNAMDSKSGEASDKLASTLEAVHQSLKQLVQQAARGGPMSARPRGPFAEARAAMGPAQQVQAATSGPHAPEARPEAKPAPTQTSETGVSDAKQPSLRDRLGAAIPDFEETETPPAFGRAKRASPDEEAVDLDSTAPRRAASQSHSRKSESLGLDSEAPDDLVAAARRAAQAAAARAEERGARRSRAHLAGSAPGAEQAGRRKRSLLIISAAVLLALSAALLYGRLSSKPEPEATPAAIEETMPPAETDGITTAPDAHGETTPPATDPGQSGSWAPMLEPGFGPHIGPMDGAVGEATTGVTDIAKSSGRVPPMPASELAPEPQLASLTPMGQAALPPGVIFSIEEPASATAETVPETAPLPPAALGPKPLREAAANGDAAAQYAVAIRYADGIGTKRDLKAAAEWLERAARAGLAPAQYRLAAMYERGVGVEQNRDQARYWYKAAAEGGNIKAMHNLAVSASGRDGSTPDYAVAAKWYGEAAAHGLSDSQFNLGILAEHGLGMTKNLSEAYKWFALAAAHGDTEAARRREMIRVQLAPETLAEAEAAAKAWTAKEPIAAANDVAENPAWTAKTVTNENSSLVSRAQTLLNSLGYDVGPPDGLAGSRTRSAIKAFQERNGLEATGEVSVPLVTQLERLAS